MPDVLSLDELVPADLQARFSLSPAPRFAGKTFEQFVPQHPSQAQALSEVKTFLENLTSAKSRGWPWRKMPEGKGLYLDGGYGVGKTHLLAAAYAACRIDVQRKAYLSFSDLVHAIGLLGVEAFQGKIKGYRLYCIDEFELDDPGNTTLIY